MVGADAGEDFVLAALRQVPCTAALHRYRKYTLARNTSTCYRNITDCSVQFCPLTDWVVVGDMRDDSAEILSQSFLQEALVSSSGMGRDVHSLMLSIQHFLCRPRRRPPSRYPEGWFLERLS